MSLEYCNECSAQTGRAGRNDDSLYHSSEGPFCEDCFDSWAEKSIEKIDTLRAENEQNRLKVTALEMRLHQASGMSATKILSLESELAALRQPVANEREAFEGWATHICTDRQPLRKEWYLPATQTAWEAWKARAALSAPAAGLEVSALVEFLADEEALEGCLEWVKREEQTVNVGEVELAGVDTLLESSAGWITRLLTAALAARKAGGSKS